MQPPTPRQPERHAVVTHVFGTFCYLCVRAGHAILWRRECPPINERNAHFIGIDSTHLLATYTRTYTTRARHPMATGTNVELLALSGKRGEAWHRRTAARSPICCWVEGQSVKMNLGSLEPRQAVKVAPCNCHGVPILPRTGQTSVLYVEL